MLEPGDRLHYSAASLRVLTSDSKLKKEITMARLIGNGTDNQAPKGHDFDVPEAQLDEKFQSIGDDPTEEYWDRVTGVEEKGRELELMHAEPRGFQEGDPLSPGEDAAMVKAAAKLGLPTPGTGEVPDKSLATEKDPTTPPGVNEPTAQPASKPGKAESSSKK